MNDRGIRLSLVAMTLLTGLAAWAGPRPWPHENSDLAPDPAVAWGRLDNGVRYVFMPNRDPPGRVSLRLRVDAGSLMEAEPQRGLAHFLEHMAFNGTRHFPAADMVKYFQRLGMAFGADTNAHTGFDETVYKLQLPDNSGELLGTALKLLRDYADGMLLEDDEIERERGVILSEKRARDSVAQRIQEAQMAFMFPDSIIPDRMPIGTEEVISSAPRAAFLEFYGTWYGAGQLTVVCVGDLDKELFVKTLAEHFGSMASRAPAKPETLGKVIPDGHRAALHTEMEAGSATLTLFNNFPASPETDTLARQRKWLQRYAACWLLNRRFEELAKKEDAPFLSASSYAYPWLDFVQVAAVRATCAPEKWREALATAEQELRRAFLHGFTASELAEVKASLLNEFESAARAAATRKSSSLSDAIVRSLGDNSVFMSPQQELAWAGTALAELTAEHLHGAFAALWNMDNTDLFAAGNLRLESPEETLLAAFRESRRTDVAPPAETAVPVFAYTDFGAPGTVADTRIVDDLQITCVTFANGVTLYIKKTDFAADQIVVATRFGRGKLESPEALPGLAMLADSVFIPGGLGKHSHDDIRRLLAGRNANLAFEVGEDAFSLHGSTTPQDMTLFFQLLAAYMSDPGYRPEALGQVRRGLDKLYVRLQSTPEGTFQNKVARFMAGGDPRFGFPEKTDLASRTLDEVAVWLKPALTQSFLHVAVVGDLDTDAVVKAVAGTLAALPRRAAVIEPLTERRKLDFPPPPGIHSFTCDSELPKAIATVNWPTEDIWDIARSRRLGTLADILDDRLRIRIREEQGDTYSPYAYSTSSPVYTGFGVLVGGIVAAPEKAADLAGEILAVATRMASDGIDSDELERALAPRRKQIEEYRRSNGYWLDNVLLAAREFPQRLDWARTMVEDIESITPDDINRLAAKYLTCGTAVQILVLPGKPGAPFSPDSSPRPDPKD